MQTAILDQLSAPLCRAVTGRDDAHGLLTGLVRKNLFVVALDDRDEWYRYHHLFGELLRAELERERPCRRERAAPPGGRLVPGARRRRPRRAPRARRGRRPGVRRPRGADVRRPPREWTERNCPPALRQLPRRPHQGQPGAPADGRDARRERARRSRHTLGPRRPRGRGRRRAHAAGRRLDASVAAGLQSRPGPGRRDAHARGRGRGLPARVRRGPELVVACGQGLRPGAVHDGRVAQSRTGASQGSAGVHARSRRGIVRPRAADTRDRRPGPLG